jgi:hypothetical protein
MNSFELHLSAELCLLNFVYSILIVGVNLFVIAVEIELVSLFVGPEFDLLGWFVFIEFEVLIESELELELGLGVESAVAITVLDIVVVAVAVPVPEFGFGPSIA